MNAYPRLAWDNLLSRNPGPTITHSPDAPGYPFANLSDWRDYTFWMSSASGELFVKLDASPLPGQIMTVDTLALAGHNLKTAGVTGLGLYSSDNDSEYLPCFPPFAPESDRVIFRAFPAQTRKFFKLVIPQGYTQAPRLGILFLGVSMIFPAFPDPGFDPDQQTAEVEMEYSRLGKVLGLVPKFRQREIKLGFSHLPPRFIADEFLPFFSQHGLAPCFLAWDYQNHPEEAYLVRLATPRLAAPYERAFRSLELSLIGTVEE